TLFLTNTVFPDFDGPITLISLPPSSTASSKHCSSLVRCSRTKVTVGIRCGVNTSDAFIDLPRVLFSARLLFILRKSQHRQPQPLLLRTLNRHLIPRIRMPHHPGTRIIPQHPRNPLVRLGAAIAHDHHAGVLRVTHTHATTMMQR